MIRQAGVALLLAAGFGIADVAAASPAGTDVPEALSVHLYRQEMDGVYFTDYYGVGIDPAGDADIRLGDHDSVAVLVGARGKSVFDGVLMLNCRTGAGTWLARSTRSEALPPQVEPAARRSFCPQD